MADEPTAPKPLTPLSPLTILRPDEIPAPRSNAEKYGALFYLGLAGLVILLLLIGRFAYGLWSTRDLWAAIYEMNDASVAEDARVDAALRVARHPSSNSQMLREASLHRDLPPRARYVLAEAMTPDALRDGPRAYALAVARSEGWPEWLRLLHLRPLAYGAGEGRAIAQEPLRELTTHPDPILRLWAHYTLAESSPSNTADRQALETASSTEWPGQGAATLLLEALNAPDTGHRESALDRATAWLRENHPPSVLVWSNEEAAPTTKSSAAAAPSPPPPSDTASPSSTPASLPGSE
jgi:hypothetical protein